MLTRATMPAFARDVKVMGSCPMTPGAGRLAAACLLAAAVRVVVQEVDLLAAARLLAAAALLLLRTAPCPSIPLLFRQELWLERMCCLLPPRLQVGLTTQMQRRTAMARTKGTTSTRAAR